MVIEGEQPTEHESYNQNNDEAAFEGDFQNTINNDNNVFTAAHLKQLAQLFQQ